jgi:hemerythrin superfamily protein
MKVTVLLRNDHDIVKALFNKFKKLSGARPQNGKKELFNEMRKEILIHSQMEHEIFYPAVRATPSPRAAELIANAEQQHRSVEKLMHELAAMNGTEKNFDAKVSQIMDEVTHHIEMEEEEIFEEARKNLPEYRLEELGLEMEDRKKILLSLAA